ncbi:peptide chain release factor 1 [Deferribacterales bacterium Es71-Z0220]|jgi:peptide chain release factor 1|uniref:peptide chain release factor 1 n=1 Tax=Deferrivibrio essentukiensis TaxID=2880922 RepID=UPI001F6033E9|nr:peptide chain release factor 1 [Deferrivibrio essentukiensis]MBZ4672349.1 prfA [Deferribacteraceae bacterium]MCB4203735.1 peptide chain release factor 1 [Deferrivibrio essentukiensis]
MFSKLEEIVDKYNEITGMISDPAIISDQEKYQKLAKELSDLKPIVEKYEEYKAVLTVIDEAKEILKSSDDKELVEMAEMDIDENKEKIAKLTEELKLLLLPKDPYDEKNIYLEIRAGTGGDEASLFAGDLLRMYTRYAEMRRWKAEIVDFNETGVGGYKEVVVLIKGYGAYSRLKYEAGGHRVQRIPTTESGGRIHTSACTVAVLPEAEDVDIEINPTDLRIDVYRSSGAGGQHVNTTDSAVRITHEPTGIVVTCQDERSQIKNREKAMKLLKAKLLEMEIRKQAEEVAENRKLQVGSGDRSERIRTYNFPQNRVTDHRINLTIYHLDRVLEGELDELIDALITFDQTEKLKQAGL